jgi:hypothetical protein
MSKCKKAKRKAPYILSKSNQCQKDIGKELHQTRRRRIPRRSSFERKWILSLLPVIRDPALFPPAVIDDGSQWANDRSYKPIYSNKIQQQQAGQKYTSSKKPGSNITYQSDKSTLCCCCRVVCVYIRVIRLCDDDLSVRPSVRPPFLYKRRGREQSVRASSTTD